MAIEWLKRLTESADEKEARKLKEIQKSDMFRDAVRDMVNSMKDEEARQEEAKRQAERERIEKARVDAELVGESMQDSPEPFANVLAIGFDKERGVKIKIDYNPAFIKYLTAMGVKGSNDDEIVRIWLAHLADDILKEESAQDYLLNGVSESEQPAMSYDDMMKEMQSEDLDEDESDNRW